MSNFMAFEKLRIPMKKLRFLERWILLLCIELQPTFIFIRMKKTNYMSWESYFMSLATLSAFRSKDQKTQTGACIIGPDNKVIGIGYNGLPIGLDDSDSKFWQDTDDSDIEHSKHTYVVHAERNAIYNSFGQTIKGATLYATLFPCANCAQTIIQSGIRRVVYNDIKKGHESENLAVMTMFQ